MGKRIWSIARVFFLAMGILWSIMLLLAFTSIPFHLWYRYSMHFAGISRPPDYVVLLGGGGMPSESNLIRSWYAAKAANAFPQSAVIIALPGDPGDSASALNIIKQELIFRGVDPERILLEDSGANTRAQAMNILEILRANKFNDIPHDSTPSPILNSQFSILNSPFSILHSQSSILLVTSPEHLYRSVLTFRKAGFRSVSGLPAFEQAIESDITFQGERLGGRRWVPDIGGQVTLRYRFWTQIHYEIIVLREWLALAYYKLKGWI